MCIRDSSTPHVVGVTYMSPQDVLATYGDMLADYTNLQQVFENDNPFTPNYRVAVDLSLIHILYKYFDFTR